MKSITVIAFALLTFTAHANATAGHREISCVAVYTPTAAPAAKCSANTGKEMKVISSCDGTGRSETTLSALLPDSFGPDALSINNKSGSHS